MENVDSLYSCSSFFEVKLESFGGPIDLLLHLVKERELEIEIISLAEVTQQYLNCIEEMRDYDLDIAAEYLVVAATLISIKAAVLLADPIDFANTPEDKLPDPHRELLEKLRAAKVYKDGAENLASRKILGVDVFAKESSLSEIESPEPGFVNHDVLLLGEAFRKLLERTGTDGSMMRIQVDSVTVVERMVRVIDTLKAAGGSVNFVKLIPDAGSRFSIIVCFVALLELTKRRAISLRQEDSYGDIVVNLGSEELSQDGLSSEFDDLPKADTESLTVNE